MKDLPIYKYKWTFIIVCIAVSTNAVLLCSLSRFFCAKKRYLVRGVSFCFPYMFGISPFIIRFFTCVITGEQCIYETLHVHFLTYLTSVAMIIFFVSKWPERHHPGKFDFFFHSHQLFHFASATSTTSQLYSLQIDAIIRRDLLQLDHYFQPDLFNTIIPLFAVLLLGCIIIGILSFLLFKGVILSNKCKPHEKES